ncbi:MAG: hypothetical protein IT393_06510 [Nitrospirae bacterium]|nr:hypothetical protein [Nitrospirota bacterium]
MKKYIKKSQHFWSGLVLLFVIMAFPVSVLAAPAILFTDILSGPNTGGKNNNGVFVCIYGKNFGATQGLSKVFINNTEVASYEYWGVSDTAPNYYDKICVQPGTSVTTGAIKVRADGVNSNTDHTFTVRSGNIYFVDLNSPASPGTGTYADPFRNPNSCINNSSIVAGDTCYFRGGTYGTNTTPTMYGYTTGGAVFTLRDINNGGSSRSGTSSAPIAFVGYPGEDVFLNAQGSSSPIRGFRGYFAPDWITVAGFRVLAFTVCFSAGSNQDRQGNGWRIVANNCNGLTTTNMVQTGTILPGKDNAKVLGNRIWGGRTGSKFDHAVYSQACSQDTEMAFNHVYDNSFDSGPLLSLNYESTNCASTEYAGNVYMHDNFLDATNYPVRCIYIYEQSYRTGDPTPPPTAYIYNNVFYNCGYSTDGALALANGNAEIYNNTFYNTRSYAISFNNPNGAPIPSVIIKNNIFHNQSGSNGYYRQSDIVSSLTSSNNLYYGLGTYSGTEDSNPRTGDPLFVNPTAKDLHLRSSSPAFKAGLSTVNNVLTKDFEGILRTKDSFFDIGAYEYVVTPPVNLR